MELGVIGTGTIATAVVRGIAKDGHGITVSKRNADNAAMLASEHGNVSVGDNQDVVNHAGTVLVALLPDIARQTLPELRFRPNQTVISLVADISLEELSKLVAPASAQVVILPFPSVAHGGSPILAFGNTDLVRELFEPANTVFPVSSEQELSAFLAAQALLSPVAFMIQQAGLWLEEQTGVSTGQGDTFLQALVASSLTHLDSSTLLQELDTPGGYNQRLLQHLKAHDLSSVLLTGLNRL